jgi:hypothetical protein
METNLLEEFAREGKEEEADNTEDCGTNSNLNIIVAQVNVVIVHDNDDDDDDDDDSVRGYDTFQNWIVRTPRVEEACFSETLVITYQTTRWHNPEAHDLKLPNSCTSCSKCRSHSTPHKFSTCY